MSHRHRTPAGGLRHPLAPTNQRVDHLQANRQSSSRADPYEEAPTANAVYIVAAPRQAEQGQTVLLVDDEAAVRTLIKDVLGDLGYGLIETDNGQSALKILQGDRRIDLLITDVGMPGMNGRQLADAARALRPNLKTLFVTGYAEAAVISHGHLDAGMAIITKPFALDMLANRVRGLIDAPARR